LVDAKKFHWNSIQREFTHQEGRSAISGLLRAAARSSPKKETRRNTTRVPRVRDGTEWTYKQNSR